MSHKLLIATLFVSLGTTLQIVVGNASGIWINLALAALIAAAFFVTAIELVSLVLFSIFVVSWQPAFSFELLVFSLLPLVVFLIRKAIPLKPWIVNVAATFVALLVFNLVFGSRLLFAEPNLFLWDVLASGIFGGVVFLGLKE